MIDGILKYIGLYGFTITDLMFFAGVLLTIVILVRLYTKKNK